jgi:ABC-2 type transport system permease protein
MKAIFLKELKGYLHSLVAYIAVVVFLAGIGLPMWIFPETSVLDYGYADLSMLFTSAPYLLMFLAPAITMRSFAEEKRSGTLEILFTRPLSDMQVIGGKFLAAWAVTVIALVPTLIYYFSVSYLGNPPGNLDTPAIIGSYIGLVLLSGFFVSLGLITSALTGSQVVAFLTGGVLCFLLFYGLDAIADMIFTGNAGLVFRQTGVLYHYDALGRGLLDTRDLVYFISLTGLNLFITSVITGSRKW